MSDLSSLMRSTGFSLVVTLKWVLLSTSVRAASFEEKLINCRHRHIVFTISDELRPYFRADRNLLNILFRSAAQVIHDWALSLNNKEQFQFGMVCVLHTFGRDLILFVTSADPLWHNPELQIMMANR